jgi:hypothetical protein
MARVAKQPREHVPPPPRNPNVTIANATFASLQVAVMTRHPNLGQLVEALTVLLLQPHAGAVWHAATVLDHLCASPEVCRWLVLRPAGQANALLASAATATHSDHLAAARTASSALRKLAVVVRPHSLPRPLPVNASLLPASTRTRRHKPSPVFKPQGHHHGAGTAQAAGGDGAHPQGDAVRVVARTGLAGPVRSGERGPQRGPRGFVRPRPACVVRL